MVPRLPFPTAIQLKPVASCNVTAASVIGTCPSLRTAKNCVTVSPFATPTVALDGVRTGLLTGVKKVTVTVATSTSSMPDVESSPVARTVKVTGGGGVADVEVTVSVNGTRAPGGKVLGTWS